MNLEQRQADLRLRNLDQVRMAEARAMPLADKLVYTVAEVSALMGFSTSTIIKLFRDEPGVIVLTRPTEMHKRRYRSLRIPRAVYQRVLRRMVTP
ncbi:MAG: hypothetical protein WBQ19_01130 [Terriglobales bacterium]|jgi:hypothetical protein